MTERGFLKLYIIYTLYIIIPSTAGLAMVLLLIVM
jgi:hypothetical protein